MDAPRALVFRPLVKGNEALNEISHYLALRRVLWRHYSARGALGNRVIPDTIGCVGTGEFDLNSLRVNEEISESGKKKLRIQKYPDTCGRGLNN